MKHGSVSIIIFIIIIIAISGGVFWFTKPKPVKILIKPIDRGRIESTVANTRAGTVKACRRALLAPAVGGLILQLPVREGQKVKSGDLLLSLWNKDLQAEKDLSKSEAEAAKARAEAACLQADISDRQAKRFIALQKTQAIAEEQVDQTVTTAKAHRADCAAAKASAQVSIARQAVLQAQIERTIITAPFDGIIAEVNGEEGEYVTPSPPGILTLPAIDLVDSSCFYVTAPIDEVDASAIKPDMEARITLDAFSDRHFPGKVKRIADYVLDREKQSRTVDIEVIFTETEDMADLLPGYSADAEVILDIKDDVIRAPTEAVVNKEKVFIFLSEEKIIKERAIVAGLSNWDFTEIIKGVSEGDLVVISLDRKGVEDGAKAEVE